MSADQKPVGSLDDTGERMIPDLEANEMNRQVHLTRYEVALRHLAPTADVLDFGCGSGYGLDLLSRHTQGCCLGIDKPEAVDYARSRYPAANVTFRAGDLCAPACRHGSFGLVVSFDVIEHVADIDAYLANIAAQLDPATGVALISTPWSSRRDNRWPLHNRHHVEELSLDDFLTRLARHFAIEDIALTIGAFAVLRPLGTPIVPLDRRVLQVPLDFFLALERDYERVSRALERVEPIVEALRAETEPTTAQVHRAAGARAAETFRTKDGRSCIVPLDGDRRVSAALQAEEDGLSGLQFLPATFQRRTSSRVRVRVEELPVAESSVAAVPEVPEESDGPAGASGSISREATAYTLLARDGEPMEVRFDPIPLSRGCRYRVTLSAPGTPPGAAIGIWCDREGGAYLRPVYRRLRWHGQGHHIQDSEWHSPEEDFRAPQGSPVARGRRSRPARDLPPVHLRPWQADTLLPVKLWRALRYYGPAATLREVGAWGRWWRGQQGGGRRG